METESESIDIASIKRAALAPVNNSEPRSDQTLQHTRQVDTVRSRAHQTPSRLSSNATRSPSHAAIDTDRQSDSMPDLPSEVPETAEFVQRGSLNALPSQPDGVQQLQKMSGEGGSIEATQELSPTYFNLLISKSRSAALLPDMAQQTTENETQHTLNDGDTGHVDLTSSFVPEQPEDEGEHESDPIDFSPTQSQYNLSQFPESQRFKTPATAGKKRRYTGQTIDSPDLPRNPLLRNGAPTPQQVLALSQAFAATQAGSSPFADGPVLNPHSDRPSPNIELRARPADANTSSPLRPISEFRRATTEPASRYISRKQSQAEREKKNMQLSDAEGEDDSEDDFNSPPSIVRQQRMLQERQQKMKEQLRTISSPTRRTPRGKYGIMSSPTRGPPVYSPDISLPRPSSGEIRRVVENEFELDRHDNDLHDSEVDTEQEDEGDVVQQRSSQPTSMDEEDKENCEEPAIQIPQTTARLQRILNDFPPHIEASPLLRHARTTDVTIGEAGLESSEPSAIANSQPSQPIHHDQYRNKTDNITMNDVQLIPQSQQESEHTAEAPWLVHQTAAAVDKAGQTSRKSGVARSVGDSRERRPTKFIAFDSSSAPEHESAPAHLESTVLETSSGERPEISRNGSSQPVILQNTKTTTTSGTSNFETAPAFIPPQDVSDHPGIEMSSPPILTTPPGRKRKRMSEIAAQESPQQPNLGFDATGVLHLEPDFQNLSSQSPIRPGMRPSKRSRLSQNQPSAVKGKVPSRSSFVVDNLYREDDLPVHQASVEIDGEIIAEPGSSPPNSPNINMSVHHSGLRSIQRDNIFRIRSSGWDIGASPPQKAIPRPKSIRDTPQEKEKTRTVPSAKDIRIKPVMPLQKPSTRNFAEARSSPDPIVLVGDDIPSSRTGVDKVHGDVVAPNMVFACFNGKTRAYYPAYCLGLVDGNPSRYRIQWEGYDPDEVDIYGVRSLDIRVGDSVKIDLNGFAKVSYVVRGFKDKDSVIGNGRYITDIRGHRTLLVAPRQRKSLPAKLSTELVKEVPVANIYLDNNMWHQMKDRKFEFLPQLAPSRSISGYATPAERPSTPTTPSSRTRRVTFGIDVAPAPIIVSGLFSNMVFAISYEDDHRKGVISELIQNNGGLLLKDSFLDMVESDKVEPTDQFGQIGFTALIADRHSRKEKYMQALALNLPCLSGKWIERCIKNNDLVNWQEYLLPAGESEELEGATKSRVMDQINATDSKFADMVSSRPKVLQNMNIIVVMGKGKAELKRKPYLFLIQALGAANIEKVADLKAAKALVDRDQTFDYVFVEDREVENAKAMFLPKNRRQKGCKVEGNQLVVQSLIMGRLCN